MYQTNTPGFLNEHGFNAYVKYVALKRHFSSSYDYFKYQGKVKVSGDSFKARRDAVMFQKLSRHRDVEGMIVANMVANPKVWIGHINSKEGNDTYLAWKKRIDGLSHHIKESLKVLDDDFKTNFLVGRDGSYPLIVDLYLRRELSIEALTVLATVTNSISYWSENVVDKVVFPDVVSKIQKYEPFLAYSKENMVRVIKSHFF